MNQDNPDQPKAKRGRPQNNPKVDAENVTNFTDYMKKTPGRPAKLTMPPMPTLEMTDGEKAIFTYFLDSYHAEFPDLTPTDELTLYLAAAEFVKTMRVMADEFSTGQVLSQARQHPSVQLRAYLDMLSVTRKQRKPSDSSGDTKDTENFLMNLSKKPKAE